MRTNLSFMYAKMKERVISMLMAVVMVFTSIPMELLVSANDTDTNAPPDYGIVIYNTLYKEANNSTVNCYRVRFEDQDGRQVPFDSEIHLNGSDNDLYLVPDPLTGDDRGKNGAIIELDNKEWADLSGTPEFRDFLLKNKIKAVEVELLEVTLDSKENGKNNTGNYDFLVYEASMHYTSDTQNDLGATLTKKYSGPRGEGITRTFTSYKLDANGAPIQAVDEEGNPLLDENSQPIYQTEDTFGFATWEVQDGERVITLAADPEDAFKSQWTSNSEPHLRYEYPPLYFTSTVMKNENIEIEWMDNDTHEERAAKDIAINLELYQNGNETFDNLYEWNKDEAGVTSRVFATKYSRLKRWRSREMEEFHNPLYISETLEESSQRGRPVSNNVYNYSFYVPQFDATGNAYNYSVVTTDGKIHETLTGADSQYTTKLYVDDNGTHTDRIQNIHYIPFETTMVFKDEALKLREDLSFVLNEKFVPLNGSGLVVDRETDPTNPVATRDHTIYLDESYTITKNEDGTYTYTKTYTTDKQDIKENGRKGTVEYKHEESYTVTITESSDGTKYNVAVSGSEKITEIKQIGNSQPTETEFPVENATYSGSFDNDIDVRPSVPELFKKNFEVCSDNDVDEQGNPVAVISKNAVMSSNPVDRPEMVDHHYTITTTVTDPETGAETNTKSEYNVTFHKIDDTRYVARYNDGLEDTDPAHVTYKDFPFTVSAGQTLSDAFLAAKDANGQITFEPTVQAASPVVMKVSSSADNETVTVSHDPVEVYAFIENGRTYEVAFTQSSANEDEYKIKVYGLDELTLHNSYTKTYYLRKTDRTDENLNNIPVNETYAQAAVTSDIDPRYDYYRPSISNQSIYASYTDRVYEGGTMTMILSGEDDYASKIIWNDNENMDRLDPSKNFEQLSLWRYVEDGTVSNEKYDNRVQVGSAHVVKDTGKDENGNSTGQVFASNIAKYDLEGRPYVYYAKGDLKIENTTTSYLMEVDPNLISDTAVVRLQSDPIGNHSTILATIRDDLRVNLVAGWVAEARQSGTSDIRYILQRWVPDPTDPANNPGTWKDVIYPEDLENANDPANIGHIDLLDFSGIDTYKEETAVLPGMKYDAEGHPIYYRLVQSQVTRRDGVPNYSPENYYGADEPIENKMAIYIDMNGNYYASSFAKANQLFTVSPKKVNQVTNTIDGYTVTMTEDAYNPYVYHITATNGSQTFTGEWALSEKITSTESNAYTTAFLDAHITLKDSNNNPLNLTGNSHNTETIDTVTATDNGSVIPNVSFDKSYLVLDGTGLLDDGKTSLVNPDARIGQISFHNAEGGMDYYDIVAYQKNGKITLNYILVTDKYLTIEIGWPSSENSAWLMTKNGIDVMRGHAPIQVRLEEFDYDEGEYEAIESTNLKFQYEAYVKTQSGARIPPESVKVIF